MLNSQFIFSQIQFFPAHKFNSIESKLLIQNMLICFEKTISLACKANLIAELDELIVKDFEK